MEGLFFFSSLEIFRDPGRIARSYLIILSWSFVVVIAVVFFFWAAYVAVCHSYARTYITLHAYAHARAHHHREDFYIIFWGETTDHHRVWRGWFLGDTVCTYVCCDFPQMHALLQIILFGLLPSVFLSLAQICLFVIIHLLPLSSLELFRVHMHVQFLVAGATTWAQWFVLRPHELIFMR